MEKQMEKQMAMQTPRVKKKSREEKHAELIYFF